MYTFTVCTVGRKREKRVTDGDCAAGGDARPASMLFANNLRACSQACQADIMPLTSGLVVLVSQVFRATGGDDVLCY